MTAEAVLAKYISDVEFAVTKISKDLTCRAATKDQREVMYPAVLQAGQEEIAAAKRIIPTVDAATLAQMAQTTIGIQEIGGRMVEIAKEMRRIA